MQQYFVGIIPDKDKVQVSAGGVTIRLLESDCLILLPTEHAT